MFLGTPMLSNAKFYNSFKNYNWRVPLTDIRSTHQVPTGSMTYSELSCFCSVAMQKLDHLQISHVPEDDGSFLDPISAMALAMKEL